ncbi:hypothetical protein ASPBRDRAFT_448353 [Aspergillus brasiliensis CBS 101740]|uniref:Uncharacterized protein n=1 Tax=Aspergillus brasiliensis (strain CBS 101740 / IMI 381727 / IBT 21946) TaxID=767769 RepID=A0A1L9US05_ASPBC|nr:hypothetical protein ASPBRDRAFT_448353 [Aspergillus brasiliensis CBS 101740]
MVKRPNWICLVDRPCLRCGPTSASKCGPHMTRYYYPGSIIPLALSFWVGLTCQKEQSTMALTGNDWRSARGLLSKINANLNYTPGCGPAGLLLRSINRSIQHPPC